MKQSIIDFLKIKYWRIMKFYFNALKDLCAVRKTIRISCYYYPIHFYISICPYLHQNKHQVRPYLAKLLPTDRRTK